jgi:hypothetical protein
LASRRRAPHARPLRKNAKQLASRLGLNHALDIKEVLVSDLARRASLLGKKVSLGRKAQGYSKEVLILRRLRF